MGHLVLYAGLGGRHRGLLRGDGPVAVDDVAHGPGHRDEERVRHVRPCGAGAAGRKPASPWKGKHIESFPSWYLPPG